MSTMGYTCHQCPKCNEVLVFFSEASSFEAAGTPKFSDRIDEYLSFWNSGYLKECPECKHIDIPSKFTIPDKANFDYSNFDPAQHKGLRSINSSEKIENWLSQNNVPPKVEFDIRFSFYNLERVKDIDIRRRMPERQNNSRKLVEIAMQSDNPELIFQTIEICRGSNLVSECLRLVDLLEKRFSEWNPRIVQQVKKLIGQSSNAPKLIVSNLNDFELKDI